MTNEKRTDRERAEELAEQLSGMVITKREGFIAPVAAAFAEIRKECEALIESLAELAIVPCFLADEEEPEHNGWSCKVCGESGMKYRNGAWHDSDCPLSALSATPKEQPHE